MTTGSPSVVQVPRLTTEQIAQFKRDGFLVLPGGIATKRPRYFSSSVQT